MKLETLQITEPTTERKRLMQLRLNAEEKSIIERAAALSGISQAGFVRESALMRARGIIAQNK